MSSKPEPHIADQLMSDVDQIMVVMQRAFDPVWGEAWNRKQVKDALTFPTTFCVLMDHAGQDPTTSKQVAAGFILTRYVAGEEELLLIAVAPEHRKRGLGRKLIDQMAQNARTRGAEKVFLEMRYNNPAEGLYRQVGFEPIGKRSNYYLMADGRRIDAITFAMPL